MIKEKHYQGGNIENKYENPNYLVSLLMSRFQKKLLSLVQHVNPHHIHEVGCGEGYLTRFIANSGYAITGSDISPSVIDYAKSLTSQKNSRVIDFKVDDLYNLNLKKQPPHLIICCEVLEHLEHPTMALEKLASVANPYIILSVPREPLWRILNCLRGKYLKNGGNTPGHIQHWGKNEFICLVSRYFDILKINTIIPWTMLLAKIR